MKRKLKKVSTVALGVGLASSSLLASYLSTSSKVQATTTTQQVIFNNSKLENSSETLNQTEQLLNNLTPEQKKALVNLQSINETGLHLAPNIDKNSLEEISVIVEFKQPTSTAAVLEAATVGKVLDEKDAEKLVDDSHASFKNDLAKVFPAKGTKKASTYKVNRTFKTTFNGVSMKLPANQVENLLKSETVKAVYSDVEIKAEPPVQAKDIAPEQLGLGMADERSYLQVGKLHAEGHTGKGM